MYEYLEKKLDTTHHIIIVADEKNRVIENDSNHVFRGQLNYVLRSLII